MVLPCVYHGVGFKGIINTLLRKYLEPGNELKNIPRPDLPGLGSSGVPENPEGPFSPRTLLQSGTSVL